MQTPVLIEPTAGNGFLAKTGEPLPLQAEGATRADALKNIEKLIAKRQSDGAANEPVELKPSDNPWLAMAGMHDPKDPEIVAWKREVEKYREARDAESEE